MAQYLLPLFRKPAPPSLGTQRVRIACLSNAQATGSSKTRLRPLIAVNVCSSRVSGTFAALPPNTVFEVGAINASGIENKVVYTIPHVFED